jgi:hypothetical protein
MSGLFEQAGVWDFNSRVVALVPLKRCELNVNAFKFHYVVLFPI